MKLNWNFLGVKGGAKEKAFCGGRMDNYLKLHNNLLFNLFFLIYYVVVRKLYVKRSIKSNFPSLFPINLYTEIFQL